jgi:hypothetical protein
MPSPQKGYSVETCIISRAMGESPSQKYERLDRIREKRNKATLDLVKLAVLVVVGAAIGLAVAHQVEISAPAMKLLNETAHRKMRILPLITWSLVQKASLYGLLSYIGAATIIGVGLLNRMLKNSMFVVPIGSPLGVLCMLLFSSLIGVVCLPGVFVWRGMAFIKTRK